MRKARRAEPTVLEFRQDGREASRARSLLAGRWWDVSATEAVALQRELAAAVDVVTPLPSGADLIAASDVSFNVGGDVVYAVVVVWQRSMGKILQRVGVAEPPVFPYVPGLLSFREIPPLLKAFGKLHIAPDVLLVDGQGCAHPRRLGIASHLGLCLDLPSVGCAKSVLCGRYGEPGSERGARAPLVHRGEVIGYALRTRTNVSPVFVSPGHRFRFDDALALVMSVTSRYRIPDPIREAHRHANELRLSGLHG